MAQETRNREDFDLPLAKQRKPVAVREMRSPLFVKARISSLKKSIVASVMLSAVLVSEMKNKVAKLARTGKCMRCLFCPKRLSFLEQLV